MRRDDDDAFNALTADPALGRSVVVAALPFLNPEIEDCR